jgi:cell division protein YceG involved in septum cleavage
VSWFLLPFLAACSPVGAPGPADAPTVEFVVPKGATARALGPSLAEAGLVHGDWAWALFLRTTEDARCVKAGKHAVSPSMTAEALLAEAQSLETAMVVARIGPEVVLEGDLLTPSALNWLAKVSPGLKPEQIRELKLQICRQVLPQVS